MPTTELTQTTGTACAACPHDRDAHDAIGTRFCSATIGHGLSRGCVCAADAPVVEPRPA